jgi:hypothetical protein
VAGPVRGLHPSYTQAAPGTPNPQPPLTTPSIRFGLGQLAQLGASKSTLRSPQDEPLRRCRGTFADGPMGLTDPSSPSGPRDSYRTHWCAFWGRRYLGADASKPSQ